MSLCSRYRVSPSLEATIEENTRSQNDEHYKTAKEVSQHHCREVLHYLRFWLVVKDGKIDIECKRCDSGDGERKNWEMLWLKFLKSSVNAQQAFNDFHSHIGHEAANQAVYRYFKNVVLTKLQIEKE